MISFIVFTSLCDFIEASESEADNVHVMEWPDLSSTARTNVNDGGSNAGRSNNEDGGINAGRSNGDGGVNNDGPATMAGGGFMTGAGC